MLGEFRNTWFDGQVAIPASFHRDCWDTLAHALSHTRGNSLRDRANYLFDRSVALADKTEATKQLSNGVCARFDAVQRGGVTTIRHDSRQASTFSKQCQCNIGRDAFQPKARPSLTSLMTLDANGTTARAVAMGLERNGFAIMRANSATAWVFERACCELDVLGAAGKLAPGKVAECGSNGADRADLIAWLADICDASATVYLRTIRSAIDAYVAQCGPWLSRSLSVASHQWYEAWL